MPHKPEKNAAPTLAAPARIILEWSSMARRGSVFNRRSYLEKCNRRNIRKSLEARVGIGPETPLFGARMTHLAAQFKLSLSPLSLSKLISIGVRFGVRWLCAEALSPGKLQLPYLDGERRNQSRQFPGLSDTVVT